MGKIQHSENDIIYPAMLLLHQRRRVRTSYLVKEVPNILELTAVDKETLPSRGDARITQIVRNLVSHRKLQRLGYATYDGEFLTITEKGDRYVSAPGN